MISASSPRKLSQFTLHRLAAGQHDLAIDDHGVDAASGLAIDHLARGSVERLIGVVGQVDQREIGFHAGLQLADLAGQPDRPRAADGGSVDRVASEHAGRLAIHALRQQRIHLHRLEQVLAIAAAAIVAAEREIDARAFEIEQRRCAVLELQVGERVMHHAGADPGQFVDLRPRQINAVRQRRAMREQADLAHVAHIGATEFVVDVRAFASCARVS